VNIFAMQLHESTLKSAFGVGILSVASLSACAPQKPPEAPTVEAAEVVLTVPTVKPIEAGSETQSSKGVTISVVPVTHSNSERRTAFHGVRA